MDKQHAHRLLDQLDQGQLAEASAYVRGIDRDTAMPSIRSLPLRFLLTSRLSLLLAG